MGSKLQIKGFRLANRASVAVYTMGEHYKIEDVKAVKGITCGGSDMVYVALIIAEGGVITF